MFFKKKEEKAASEADNSANSAEGADESAPLGLPPLEDSENDSESESMDDAPEEQAPAVATSAATGAVAGIGPIVADVERMKAQMQAVSEMRKVTGERFTRVSESIGELRSMLTSHEKAMSRIEVKATKAEDMVSSVQPEKLMIEVRRQDTKVEALKSRLESNQLINEQLREELKEIRRKISLFRGVEEILQLNEDVKKELRGIQKVKAHTERSADKVETIFIEVEKNFAEFKRFKDMVEDLNKNFKEMIKQMDTMKAKFNSFASKNEFSDFTKNITEKTDKLNTFVQTIEQSQSMINNIADKVSMIEANHSDIERMHENLHENFLRVGKWVTYFKSLENRNPSKNVPDLDIKNID